MPFYSSLSTVLLVLSISSRPELFALLGNLETRESDLTLSDWSICLSFIEAIRGVIFSFYGRVTDISNVRPHYRFRLNARNMRDASCTTLQLFHSFGE